jgi:putative addiction module component (TIGR02574 family)
MASQFEVLEAEALKLGAADRARLVEHLIACLDEDTEIEEAWAAEVERRMEAVDTGSAELIPAADQIARARAALK